MIAAPRFSCGYDISTTLFAIGRASEDSFYLQIFTKKKNLAFLEPVLTPTSINIRLKIGLYDVVCLTSMCRNCMLSTPLRVHFLRFLCIDTYDKGSSIDLLCVTPLVHVHKRMTFVVGPTASSIQLVCSRGLTFCDFSIEP